MKVAVVSLKSISPLSMSRFHDIPKLEKEGNDDHEKRTWRERLHYNDKGNVIIPPMMFKNSLSECAKYLSMQIPGKGKATYTKHFEAGIICIDPIILNILKDNVQGEWVHVPSDGVRGGTKRVPKCFPLIPSWEGDVVFTILDDTITKEAFKYHIEQTGKFIGIGRFRPRKNGYYGRFSVESIKWEE